MTEYIIHLFLKNCVICVKIKSFGVLDGAMTGVCVRILRDCAHAVHVVSHPMVKDEFVPSCRSMASVRLALIVVRNGFRLQVQVVCDRSRLVSRRE